MIPNKGDKIITQKKQKRTFPHDAYNSAPGSTDYQYVEKNPYGHVFSYPHPPMALQVSDLQGWGCLSVQTALEHPDSKNWVWVYIDGSWDNPHSGSASIMVTHDLPLAKVLLYPLGYEPSLLCVCTEVVFDI